MKKYFNIIAILFLTVFCSSCLMNNLEELDTYEGNDITSVVGAYHRYYDDSYVHNASGEVAVKQSTLNVSNTSIDEEKGTCTFDVSVPGNLPQSQVGKVDAKNLVVLVNISTASICTPIDGAPALGKSGDWSKPNKYKIKAANGDEQVWTISLTLK